MSEVTIKLDLQTLKDLFGGDDPPSVEFRNAIANKFASEYLKSLVTSELARKRDELVIDEVKQILYNTVLEDTNWAVSGKKALQSHYKNLIAVTVDAEVSKLISSKLIEATDKIKAAEHMAKNEILQVRDTTIKHFIETALSEANIKQLVEDNVKHYIENFSKQMLEAVLMTASKNSTSDPE